MRLTVSSSAFCVQDKYSHRVDVGAGGQQEPYLVNGANSLTFGIMVFGCSIFAVLANKFGLKNVLILGTLGYAPYSASLYGRFYSARIKK